jgi:diguanylate cyclase (GGDEF)-like protein/PAS domain S-box-containing protein
MHIFYSLVLSFVSFVTLFVGVIAWRRRQAPGGVGLLLYQAGMFTWTTTYAIRWLAVDPLVQQMWLDATYLGLVIGLYGMVIFALQITNREQLLTRRNLILLAVEPVVISVLLWTDRYHGWFYAGMRSTDTILNGGVGFWFNIFYSFLVSGLTILYLLGEYMRASHLGKRQIGVVLIGMLMPALGNILSFLRVLPSLTLDYTPIFFTFSGLFFYYALQRSGLMEILPVAYDRLFERMPDGVLVMDERTRLVEINPPARSMTGIGLDQIGKPANEILSHWPGLSEAALAMEDMREEIQITSDPVRHIEVRVMPLLSKNKRRDGILILLRDLTERIRMENRLRQMSTHDGLTGLYNRAYFEGELARLERGQNYPVSLLLVDVDNLKKVNDSQGHAAGDEILKRTAAVLNDAFRSEDIITRIGGDEFVVILSNTGASLSDGVMQRLQQALENHNRAYPTAPLELSVGYSTADVNTPPNEAFKIADEAMYLQKKGRRANRQ